ncbi:hypothetical protein [Citrobacter sp. JGM124]|uniref:hypothetical protein n=1 Tax=Citrobacter sp. JGM124 TaxID=2799789 RepID=UPI001BA4BDF1|nr:hypothetical protein [Citrobacter sp. JGM124]MBS0847267.1 hypothetical protein [Citrobacter sp. JGM124]
MNNIRKYTIPLDENSVESMVDLSKLLEAHASVFSGTILSAYGGDIRYAIVDDSFTITNISAEKINYCCKINYFAPCNGQNEVFEGKGEVSYNIVNNKIILELDETLWNVD